MALSRPLGESQEEEWYDIFLIYEEDTDEDEAFAFKDLIEKHVDLPTFTGSRRPRVCMVSNDGSFPLIQSKFDHLEKCIKCSTFVFLYVTPEFLKNQWAKMRRNSALAESLDNEDTRIVLVYAASKKSMKLPVYNREIRDLDLTEFLQGEKLQSIISSKSMMESRKKCKFLRLLTNVLDAQEKSLMSMQSANVTSVDNICDYSSVNARLGDNQADPEDSSMNLSLGDLHLSDTSDKHPSEMSPLATNMNLPIQHQSEEFEEPQVTPANEHFATPNSSLEDSKDTVDSKAAIPMSDDTAQLDRSPPDGATACGTGTLPPRPLEDIDNKYGPIQINTNNFAPIVTTANKQSESLNSD